MRLAKNDSQSHRTGRWIAALGAQDIVLAVLPVRETLCSLSDCELI
jgi:hypothetical protein